VFVKIQLACFLDFRDEWCNPCRIVGAAIEQLSQTMGD
jgi:hypothetical protein